MACVSFLFFLSTLSSCMHAVVALLYPFSWQHTFIPVLPSSMLDIVCCPTPFLVGLLSSSLPKLKELPVEEVRGTVYLWVEFVARLFVLVFNHIMFLGIVDIIGLFDKFQQCIEGDFTVASQFDLLFDGTSQVTSNQRKDVKTFFTSWSGTSPRHNHDVHVATMQLHKWAISFWFNASLQQ